MTDTIDALWRTVEQHPIGAPHYAHMRSRLDAQLAVLERLIDAYLDADMNREAEAVRRLVELGREAVGKVTPPHLWRRQTGEWLAYRLGQGGVMGHSARALFEQLLKMGSALD